MTGCHVHLIAVCLKNNSSRNCDYGPVHLLLSQSALSILWSNRSQGSAPIGWMASWGAPLEMPGVRSLDFCPHGYRLRGHSYSRDRFSEWGSATGGRDLHSRHGPQYRTRQRYCCALVAAGGPTQSAALGLLLSRPSSHGMPTGRTLDLCVQEGETPHGV